MENVTIRKNNHGFTLVEMIVVMVILSVLLSFGAGALINYQKYAAYKRNNEYAETIFAASQSALTHYKATGQLKELEASMAQSRKVGAAIAGSAERDYTGRLYYLDISVGEDLENNVLYQLIGNYVYDISILRKAAIRLEFDPVDGTVYSVCYSDRAEKFDESNADGSGGTMGVSRSNRETSRRKQIILGYYASELSEDNMPSSTKPTISSVQLVNEEQLLLIWKMDSRLQSQVKQFSYAVRIYSKNDELRFAFTIDGSQLPLEDGSSAVPVSAEVTFYNVIGNPSESGTYSFYAYVSSGKDVCLVLDAIDLKAAEILDTLGSSSSQESYKDTYSIRRFLDTPQKIYAKVQATSGSVSGEWKPSNTEHSLMDVSADSSYYEVNSARHLFNIRFMESTEKTYKYRQSADIIWGGEEGTLAQGNVFNGKTLVEDKEQEFPAISLLGEKSSYSAKPDGSKNTYQIENLILQETGSDGKLGLFCENRGSIHDMVFVNVSVDGQDDTGTVCGLNSGTLQNITVSSGSVKGKNHVGGIAGRDSKGDTEQTDSDTYTYEQLNNEASVSGESYTGGVIGSSEYDRFRECSNTGGILADSSESYYIGGILGYNESASLESCKSSMDNELPEGFTMDSLKGTYVGGLVGYHKSGTIEGCETLSGYVIGGMYVGGFTGVNEAGTLGGEEIQVNRANVIAWKYAGGITGVNARVDVKDLSEPIMEYNSEFEIKNFTNQGIISAGCSDWEDAGGYGGGIAGINAGIITNCQTDVSLSEGLKEALRQGNYGDYIGGIAGYNIGEITVDSSIPVNSVAAGRNYIGGIVGYNDGAAGYGGIEGYVLSGGYISGSDFVGGYIGLNTSVSVFSEAEIISSANLVEGQWFVGGVIGGNIIVPPDNLGISFNTDNFLGEVSAADEESGYFMGGFIGYNQSVLSVEEANAAAQRLIHADAIDSIIHISEEYNGPNVKLIISGTSGQSAEISQENKENAIIGNAYIGGVVGYNSSSTELFIRNITNQTPITAYGSLADTRGKTTSLGDNIYYAYVGGIIGRITENTVIDNCMNGQYGEVTAPNATYYGGLSEINEGMIQYCTAEVVDTAENSCFGGFTGRNEKGACVIECQVTGQVSGQGIVGGIAAENYGTIQDSEVYSDITGYDYSCFGGIVGSNAGTVAGCEFSGNIQAAGGGSVYAGGIAGYSVSNENEIVISNCSNYGDISAGSGYAGGILGYTFGSSGYRIVVANCRNSGTVTGLDAASGGIVGYHAPGQELHLERCRNYGSGMYGGILGHAEDEIETYIVKCFGVRRQEVTYPVIETDTQGNFAENYYFSFDDGSAFEDPQGAGEILYLEAMDGAYWASDKDETVNIYLPVNPLSEDISSKALLEAIDGYLVNYLGQ